MSRSSGFECLTKHVGMILKILGDSRLKFSHSQDRELNLSEIFRRQTYGVKSLPSWVITFTNLGWAVTSLLSNCQALKWKTLGKKTQLKPRPPKKKKETGCSMWLTHCASCWEVCPCGQPVWFSALCPGCSWGQSYDGTLCTLGHW